MQKRGALRVYQPLRALYSISRYKKPKEENDIKELREGGNGYRAVRGHCRRLTASQNERNLCRQFHCNIFLRIRKWIC